MVKTITCKLKTDETANAILAQTRHVFAQACNQLSHIAWSESIFRQFPLHDRAYHAIRATLPTLPSQLVVRAIRVVTDSYKIDKSVQHTFSEHAAVVFDARCLKLKGTASAILTTTGGRLTLPLAHGARQRKMLEDATIGEADLLYRDGTYYLALAVKTPAPPLREVTGVLGVDLGLSQIATDSSGESFTGEVVKAVRRKCRRLRSSLQRKGTRSAKRHLQRICRRQRHFVSTLNHQIAKRIVQKALSSAKAIALETLTGILSEETVSAGKRDGCLAIGRLRTFSRRSCTRRGRPGCPLFGWTLLTPPRRVVVVVIVNVPTERANLYLSVTAVLSMPMRM